jgi:hypothetical protein
MGLEVWFQNLQYYPSPQKIWNGIHSTIHQDQPILFLKYKYLKVERHYQILFPKGQN